MRQMIILKLISGFEATGPAPQQVDSRPDNRAARHAVAAVKRPAENLQAQRFGG